MSESLKRWDNVHLIGGNFSDKKPHSSGVNHLIAWNLGSGNLLPRTHVCGKRVGRWRLIMNEWMESVWCLVPPSTFHSPETIFGEGNPALHHPADFLINCSGLEFSIWTFLWMFSCALRIVKILIALPQKRRLPNVVWQNWIGKTECRMILGFGQSILRNAHFGHTTNPSRALSHRLPWQGSTTAKPSFPCFNLDDGR